MGSTREQTSAHTASSLSRCTHLKAPSYGHGILPIMPLVPGYPCSVPGYPWSASGYPRSVPACPESVPGCWGILVGLVQSATLEQNFLKFLVFAQYSILLGKC